MKKWIIALFGGILFRIRGGLLDIFANKFYYPLFVGILYSYINNWSVYLGFLGLITAYIAQQIVGWGTYRGALVCGSNEFSPECKIIDDLLNSIKITCEKTVYYLTDYPRIWGFLGCSLRGLLSSFLFGLLAQSHEVMLCGLLVGLCYLIPTVLLWKTKYHNTKAAWNIGEYFEGALYVLFLIMYGN